MAIRLERSGGLYFIRGGVDEPEPPKRRNNLGLWLALIGLVALCFVGPQALDWAAANHTLRAFLAVPR